MVRHFVFADQKRQAEASNVGSTAVYRSVLPSMRARAVTNRESGVSSSAFHVRNPYKWPPYISWNWQWNGKLENVASKRSS